MRPTSCYSRLLAIPAAAWACMVASVIPTCVAQNLVPSSDGNIEICHIVTLLPFTDEREAIPEPHGDPNISYGYGQWPDEGTLAKASFSLLVASELARMHFNDRDTSVVPELAEFEDCNVRLMAGLGEEAWWVFDSAYSRSKTVDQLLPLVDESVCAVVGPINPRAHEGVSVITENLNVPQLGFETIDRRLERTQDFPTFLRAIPAATDFSAKIATLVGRDIWAREYVAIIYDQSDYGEQFEDPLEDAEDELGYATVTEHVIEGDDESIYGSLEEAKDKGFRTILLVTDRPAFLNDIANVAEELGMLGEGYMWLISGDAFPPAMRTSVMRYEVDSPADKMMRGAALFTNYDPFVYNGESDKFLQSWRKQSPSLVEVVADIQPIAKDGQRFYEPDPTTYFADEDPSEYSSFIYDSIIAAGIGACLGKDLPESENSHYRGVQMVEFEGASGKHFKMMTDTGEYTNTRDPSGVNFGVYNIRPGLVENGMRSYDAVLTSIWDASFTTNAQGHEVEGGAWRNVPGTEFLFYGSTSEEPSPLRTVSDEHTLSDGVQIAGFFLSGLALFLCAATAAFVVIKRKNKYIKSSQPVFCLMLCFGAALVASSLIFVSFDESDGYTTQQLSAMCTTAPWFFVIGYLGMFCALFSKLWRLNKVLSSRRIRQQVKIHQVMVPFVAIILSSIIVLSVWTAIDPLVWIREPISGFDDGEKNTDEPLETYGECASPTYGVVPFIVPLGLLFAIAISLTAVFGWRLKGVNSDFEDAKFIFFGIFTHIEVWVIGVPILVLTSQVSKNAFHSMLAVLVFTFSSSMVSFVIWTKIYFYVRDKYFGGPSTSNISAINVRGSTTQVSGATLDSATGARLTNARVASLESELSQLKLQLDQKNAEVLRLSSKRIDISSRSQVPLGEIGDSMKISAESN